MFWKKYEVGSFILLNVSIKCQVIVSNHHGTKLSRRWHIWYFWHYFVTMKVYFSLFSHHILLKQLLIMQDSVSWYTWEHPGCIWCTPNPIGQCWTSSNCLRVPWKSCVSLSLLRVLSSTRNRFSGGFPEDIFISIISVLALKCHTVTPYANGSPTIW